MKMLFALSAAALMTAGAVAADNPGVPATDITNTPPSAIPPAPARPAHADRLDISHFSPAELESMARFQTDTVGRFLGIRLHVDGVIPEMRRADKPLQWINPFAPARYGYGEGNVSTNPRTGQMEGISFLSVRF